MLYRSDISVIEGMPLFCYNEFDFRRVLLDIHPEANEAIERKF